MDGGGTALVAGLSVLEFRPFFELLSTDWPGF